jgi:hypothetical protein
MKKQAWRLVLFVVADPSGAVLQEVALTLENTQTARVSRLEPTRLGSINSRVHSPDSTG